ncbi:MAG: helix-turn-helix domain-containing protein, partial [Eubacterium sp.]|nr:helix-turn-helix domain-containing protein [Eubacterium sp.]
MAFKENLVFLRKSLNLSQEELAEKINVTRQAISKWENGQSTPDMDTILLLCDYFNVTADQLLISLKLEKVENKKNDYNRVFLILWAAFLMLICFLGFVLFIFNFYFSGDEYEDVVTIMSFFFMVLPIFIFFITFIIFK